MPENKIEISEETKELIESLFPYLSKRAQIVVNHILEHRFITTEDLEKKYGYAHPPRAARDVRESGIPLETFKVKSSDGRIIAAYKFGDLSKIQKDKLGGRKIFPKKFKEELYRISGGKCAICSGHFEMRYLQIDHRIPYEVAGENEGVLRNIRHYMLLCASCNRAKSWSCEHCPNFSKGKSPKICSTCYWASPEDYTHIALREVRRIDIIWEGEEVKLYEKLKRMAKENELHVPEFVKKIIEKCIKK